MPNSSSGDGLSTFGQNDREQPPSDVGPYSKTEVSTHNHGMHGSTNRSGLEPTRFAPAKLEARSLPVDFGDYRLIRKIGEGGMGVVYEAEQKSMGNRRLALKTIKYPGGPNDHALKRFRNEVQAVAQLEHRHIVPVYQLGEESGVHFYVMKLVDGNNLRELVNTLKAAVSRRKNSTAQPLHTKQATADPVESHHSSGWSKGNTLASNEVLERVSRDGSTAHPQFVTSLVRMAIQIATALHHVHQQGVVHRDIKPANLLLDVEGDVWLTDFGLALIRDSPSLTAPGDLVGTFQYMSPEQAMGSKGVIVDHRSDIYSLGVTLYELLTLQRAFPGHTREQVLRGVQFDNPLPVRKISPRMPMDLETIVMKAMAKDPNSRFQSAAEMAAELQRFQDGKPLTIRPPSLLEKFGYWARANRQKVASLAAMCAVTFLAAIAIAIVSVKAYAQIQLVLQAETQQRLETQRQLNRSEGLRLAANSALQVENDPTLALLLATEAAEFHPGSDANDAIMRATDIGHEARVLIGHGTPVGHVAFNHNGSRLVSSANAEEFSRVNEPAIVWDTETGKTLGKLTDEKAITSSVFSPDTFRILTASSPPEKDATNGIDDSLPAAPPSLWDVTSFRKLVTFKNAFLFKAHPRAFSPDGRRVVLPVNGNQACTFDCVAGGDLVKFSGHEARVVFAAFHPLGNQVVTYSDDNTVRIWNAESGDEILRLDHWRKAGMEKQPRDLEWVEFSPDGRRLVTGAASRGIELWDLENNGQRINAETLSGTLGVFYGNGDRMLTYGLAEMEMVLRSAYDTRWIEKQTVNKLIRKLVVSPDSRIVGMLDFSDMRTFHFWDLERREMRATLVGKHLVHDLVFSPNSEFVATASDDKHVHLWYVASGRDRATYRSWTDVGHPVVAPSPNGEILAVVTGEPAAIGAMCDFGTSKQSSTISGRISIPKPGGQRLLATSEGRLALHSMDDGSFLGLETFVHRDLMETAISRDGEHVAAFAGGKEVILWNPDTNRRLSLPVGETHVNMLRFSPDGDQLFAISDDGMIRVWSSDTGASIESLNHGGKLYDIEFSGDATRFAVTTNQDEATLYDAMSLEAIRRFSEPDARFERVRFSSDGKRLLAYSPLRSTSVLLWDIESGTLDAKLDVGGNVGVAMHPSEPEALVWSDQDGAVIWRYQENERLPVAGEPMSSGAYSTDGKMLYLASWVPALYQASKLEDWPDEIHSAKVTRWVRDGLQPEGSIDFSTEAVIQILVSDQDQVLTNGLRWNQIVNYGIESHEPIATIPGHYGPISECLYTSDSKRLITTSWDAHVSIWNVADGRLLSTRDDHRSPIVAAAISGDDKYLVTGARDGTCLVWNLVDETLSKRVALSSSPIRHVAFDRTAKHVLAITSDDKPTLFQRESGELVALDFHTDSIEWAEFSPDGTTILVIPGVVEGEDSPQEVLIVPVDGTAVTKLEYPAAVLTSHFHPDSKRMVTTTRDGMVLVQNTRSGQIEQALMHEPSFTNAARFDSAGEYVFVSGGSTGTIWRVENGRQWLTVEDRMGDYPWRHTHNPFVPGQSRRIITRRGDTFEYRDVFVDPLPEAQKQLPRSLTEAERKRFLIEE